MDAANRGSHHYNVSIRLEIFPNTNQECSVSACSLVRDFHLDEHLLAYDGRKSLYTINSLTLTSKDVKQALQLIKGIIRNQGGYKTCFKNMSRTFATAFMQIMADYIGG